MDHVWRPEWKPPPAMDKYHKGFDEKALENTTYDAPARGVLNGREWVVHRDVLSPILFPGAAYFSRAMTELLGSLPAPTKFLEVGTGAGVTAVEVALDVPGCEVCAVDISPYAVENARENAKLHGLPASKIRVLESNVFSALEGSNEKFDVIFWFYPFCLDTEKGTDELSMFERAIWDPEYKHLARYLFEAKKFLKPGGHLCMGFSYDNGNIDAVVELAKRNGWSGGVKVIGHLENSGFVEGEVCPLDVLEFVA